MTDKELRKLHRADLLEMLLEQSREMERLRVELSEAKRLLAQRRIDLEQAGSIAEASLKLNQVFEAAQRAADQYLENIREMQKERSCGQDGTEKENRGISGD